MLRRGSGQPCLSDRDDTMKFYVERIRSSVNARKVEGRVFEQEAFRRTWTRKRSQ